MHHIKVTSPLSSSLKEAVWTSLPESARSLTTLPVDDSQTLAFTGLGLQPVTHWQYFMMPPYSN